jgi:NADP-dependent aldehyde dehydrogenase
MRIESLGPVLIDTAESETRLGVARLEGERARTCNQLRMFAELLEEGSWVEAVIDTAMPARKPLPRPDLRRLLVPLGPVAVFGAGNFPLAFSTAGGDTASALAAGCPVIYKEHPDHPRTSRLVAGALREALEASGFPQGVFQDVEGGPETGQQLVAHPVVKAVAFTGSHEGGMAIYRAATGRAVPIPVFAEMGSVNPVFILPECLSAHPEQLAQEVAASAMLGCGQFCTKPGLVFHPSGEGSGAFTAALEKAFLEGPSKPMLQARIATRYYDARRGVLKGAGVKALVDRPADPPGGTPSLASAGLSEWLENPVLQQEVFGPFTLLVAYRDASQLLEAAEALQGQLTCTIRGSEKELGNMAGLIDSLRERCGRLLFSGVPTGVEVGHGMTHGGPFPATTDSRSTSVGSAAIKRFVRPVTYQSAPDAVLPPELQNANPLGILRTVNGRVGSQEL